MQGGGGNVHFAFRRVTNLPRQHIKHLELPDSLKGISPLFTGLLGLIMK